MQSMHSRTRGSCPGVHSGKSVRMQLTIVFTDMTTVRNQSAGPAGTMAVPGAEEVGISPVLKEISSKRSAYIARTADRCTD